MSGALPVRLARPEGLRCDLLVVPVFEGEAPPGEGLPPEAARAATRAARRPGWSGEEGRRAVGEGGGGVALVVLHGLGRRDRFGGQRFARWLQKAGDEVRDHGVRSAVLGLPDHAAAAGEAGALRVGRLLSLAAYRFDRFLSRPDRAPLRSLRVLPPPGQETVYRRTLPRSAAVARAIAYARDLANTPPNEATPQWLAERARELARTTRGRIRVLTPRELARRGMGGILAVGGGSAHPPRMVRLEWGRGPRTVALVGKGVTFDSGGLSIKPAAALDEMKYDKCGAVTVLGILHAAAELRLPVRLRAYLPLAENLVDARAYRPGDIITCANGKTVEILNTDAEGRLILADALSWAAREGPDALVEYSTLTGACVVALGPTGAGLFTPSDGLAADLLSAAERAGERLWRLPLWSEFSDRMKGNHADLKNTGGRWGGAGTAAAFLAAFVEDVERWAHVDLAGPAYVGSDGEGPPGATGYGIAWTVEWLRALVEAPA